MWPISYEQQLLLLLLLLLLVFVYLAYLLWRSFQVRLAVELQMSPKGPLGLRVQDFFYRQKTLHVIQPTVS